ncbi:MAG: hypothetical protein ABIG44_18570 [Planctomycetota bacterium]
MHSLQHTLFQWAAVQPAITGLVVLGLGALYAFFGFRLFQALLVLTCLALGWFAGVICAHFAGPDPVLLGGLGAAVLGLLALRWHRPAVVFACGSTWALLAYYLTDQFKLPTAGILTAVIIAGGLGALFALLSYRTMMVILTTLQGIVLIQLAFVNLSTQFLPEMGSTFRQWSNNQVLVVPIFLIMLFTAAFSYQALHQQGDIRTGK